MTQIFIITKNIQDFCSSVLFLLLVLKVEHKSQQHKEKFILTKSRVGVSRMFPFWTPIAFYITLLSFCTITINLISTSPDLRGCGRHHHFLHHELTSAVCSAGKNSHV